MWETYRAMSTDVGRIFPFLAKVSCMNEKERLNIARCEIAKMLIPHPRFKEFIDGVAIPYFAYVGRARWNKDIVSDLGLALSLKTSKRVSAKDVKTWMPDKVKKKKEQQAS